MSDTGLPDVPPPTAPKEPLAYVAAITAFVVAALALFVSFGLDISDDQQAAILGFIAPAAVIVTALWSRLKVWSPASVRAALLAVKAAPAKRSMPYTSTSDVRDPL
jgi:ABC-type nickel/cobalt efflux system permease component RcnA